MSTSVLPPRPAETIPPEGPASRPGSAPPPKKRRSKIAILAFGVVAVLGVAAISSAIDGSKSPSQPKIAALPSAVVALPSADGTLPSTAPPVDQAAALGTTRSNPFPVGTAGSGEGWTLKVVGFTPNANATVASANMFNDKPKPGEQYVLVTLRATYTGKGSSDPFMGITASLIPSDGNSSSTVSAVLPNDLMDVGNIPNGASGVGNIAFEIKASEVGSAVLYVEMTNDNTFNTASGFFALR